MSFGQAISTCFRKYADFNGRALRSEFWWWVLFINVVSIPLFTLNSLIFGSDAFPWLTVIWSLAVLIPGWAVGCRRLHDVGKSGWMQLLALVPCVGAILLIVWWVQPGSAESNVYGPGA